MVHCETAADERWEIAPVANSFVVCLLPGDEVGKRTVFCHDWEFRILLVITPYGIMVWKTTLTK